jgi:hypothetical protein
VGAFPDRAARCASSPLSHFVTAIWTDRRYPDVPLLKSKDVAVAKAT